MNNEKYDIDELIAKELSAEASSEELTWLEIWKASSVKNEDYFQEAVRLWALTHFPEIADFDVDNAWQKVKTDAGIGKQAKIRSLKTWLQIAAAVVVIACLGYFYSINSSTSSSVPTLVEINTKAIDSLLLQDNTRITVRENSTISYPEVFDSVRRVTFKGRAFFEVSKAAIHPFIITTHRGVIQVVGTSFYVDTDTDSSLTVIVTEGIVKVSMLGQVDKGVRLEKDEKVILKGSTFNKGVIDMDNHLAWQTHSLKFKREKLSEVVKVIASTYGVSIALKNKILNNCELTARYKNESLEVILENLKQTFNVTISTTPENVVVIDGEGC